MVPLSYPEGPRAGDPGGLVWIVDDDPMVRDSLAEVLRSVGLPCRSCASGEEFLDQLKEPDRPMVVILDLRMPGMGGLAALRRLRSHAPDVPVLVLSGAADVGSAVIAMKDGAYDVLQKPASPNVLVDRVYALLQAARRLHPAVRRTREVVERFATLSRREREVVALLADGKTNLGISAELGISVRTVEVHRASAMRKLGVDHVATMLRAWLLLEADGPSSSRDLSTGSEPRGG